MKNPPLGGHPAQDVHRDAREARRREVELQLVGQERKVASKIQIQLLAGFAHPQRSSQEPPPSKSSGRANASVRQGKPRGRGQYATRHPPSNSSANAAAQAPSSARAGSTLGDTFDEKLGEVFKSRIDEIIKQSN